VQHCPWDGFQPATIKFCEEQLCSWITQPANTWSNIGFVIAGIVILRLARADKRAGMHLIGISAIMTGIGSTMFHASSTFFFEFFDLMGMFMISGLLLTLNLQRLFGLSNKAVSAVYVALVTASLGLMLVWNQSGIATFALQITAAMTVELLLHLRRDRIAYKPFLLMAGTFAASFTSWALDIAKIVCDPGNHILTGHAVWHLLNAVAIYYLYRFYHQFTGDEKGKFSLERAA
jgi:hypothetical protein